MATNGVRIISAGPRLGTAILVVRVDNTQDRPIRTADKEESTRHDNENRPRDHGLPAPVAVGAAPVVVQPHAAHGLEAHEGAEEGADERDEAAEDGDRRGDDVGC